jgi:cytoskeletal protein CcmA (bactofilin family)
MLFQKKTDDDRNQSLPHDPHLVVSPISTQRASSAQRKPEGLPPRAIIAEGINIHGCLQTEGEIQIDGEINGDIRCAHLTVGRSGTVNGDISGSEVIIRGNVKGAIRAERVIIQEGAHVESDIQHDKFAIEEGAYFKGSCTPKNAQEARDSKAMEMRATSDDARGNAG